MPGRPQNVAVAPDGTELYIADIENGTVRIWDIAGNAQRAQIPLGADGSPRDAFDVVVAPDGEKIWVSALASGRVLVIDRSTRRIERVIDTGGRPRYIAFSANGRQAVIANESGWVDLVR